MGTSEELDDNKVYTDEMLEAETKNSRHSIFLKGGLTVKITDEYFDQFIEDNADLIESRYIAIPCQGKRRQQTTEG